MPNKMTIALTGGSGRVGRGVIAAALAAGHGVVNIDRVATSDLPADPRLRYVAAEATDYDALLAAMAGCDALIHLAAIPAPGTLPDCVVHNTNVTASYNALRAAVDTGISRVCLASSVNAIGLAFSREAHFDYLPLDEVHPNYCEEPYGLSKWICEQQADAFARRYDTLSIASLRFHWVVPERATAVPVYGPETRESSKHLWAYTGADAASRACLLSLTAPFTGHEVFYIVAPDTVAHAPSLDLAERFFPDLPIRGDLSGHRSFFNCQKAERLLGWKHNLA